MRLVLNYRLEKAVKCLGKKWVDVPGAHAVDITVRLLEPGHLKKIMQLRFSKTKASLESWIFVGPFEKKLENLLFSKKTLWSDNLVLIAPVRVVAL